MSGAPSAQGIFKQNAIVGVGEIAVSNNSGVTISTYALGSCISVVAYDSVAKAGGLIHIMLPESHLSPAKAATQPAMFADTGVPLLLQSLIGLNAERRRIRSFVAGGASIINGSDMFKIGERNIIAVKKVVNALAIPVPKADVGGVNNRTVHLEIETGIVTLKTANKHSTINLA